MSDEIFDQGFKEQLPPDFNAPKKSMMDFIRDKKLVLGAILGVLLVLGAIAIFFTNNQGGEQAESNNVLLLVKGPAQATSGNEVEYRFVYTNGENADLTNVSLEIIYPNNFKYKTASINPTSASGQRFNLPVLKSGEEGVVKIKGKLSGSAGEEKQVRAKLTYKMSNFNSEFALEANTTTLLLPPNVNLDITGPVDIVSGQDATFTVNYSNVAKQEFENLVITLTYPEGYQFTSSSPAPTKSNNTWTIPKLDLGETGKIEITGSFIGEANKEQLVSAELGLMINNNIAPLIVSSTAFKIIPASLSLFVEAQPGDFVNLGQNITYNLQYANTGKIGMTNVVISLTLEGTALDLTKIQANDAIVTGNVITWKSATLSNLSLISPNQNGEITFNVPIKNSLTTNLKNQVVKASAVIYSAEITKPIRGQDSEIKLASQLGLQVSGEHVTGPFPIEAGKTTEFNVTFLLTNLSNDLDNVEVVASLPLPASSWKNVIVPPSEASRLTYDPNSGKIKWKVGKLAAFVGKFSPALTATFTLQLTPNESDSQKAVNLLTTIEATAKDMFTQQDISSNKVNQITTSNLTEN